MPLTPAIPPSDPLYDAYLYNWKTLLTAAPTDFGMSASDATAISTAYTDWHAAYLLVTDPGTRTQVTVAAKNYQKALSLILLRQQYNIIKANPSVSNENKVAIGIRLNDPVPTPIPPPTTVPVLTIRNAAPYTHIMDWADSDTPTTRRKPAGATGCVIMRAVGLAPATLPSQATWEGMFARVPVLMSSFNPADVGKWATYFARWVNAKGEEGPWAAPVSQIIAA